MPTPHTFKTRFPLSPIATAVALAALGTLAPASAQQATPAAPAAAASAPAKPQLETIIVTGNKRLEKLESVPASISVLNEEVLERYNVREFDDILDLSPALTKTQSDNPANTGLNMRGIGTQSIGIGVESDVAVIVDDIPIGMQVQAFRALSDVLRIEILKGPQSTLFGKSAVAGAINIVTRPISGPIVTRASVLFSSDHEKRVALSVGGSLSDQFGFRIAADVNDYPGNVNNLTTGEKVNGQKGKTLMAKFSWRPTANLDIDFSPRYNESTISCCAIALRELTKTGTSDGLLNNIPQMPMAQVLAGITAGPDNVNIRNDTFTGQTSTTSGGGLKIGYTLPNGTLLTSITSLDRFDAEDSRDQDFTDAKVMLYYPISNTPGTPTGTLANINAGSEQHGTFRVRSQTQELRITSPDSSKLRYVAGLWYGKNDLERYFKRGEFGLASTSATEFYGKTYNVNTAIYGQASYEVLPTYTVTAGLRYNQQESGFDFEGTGNPAPLPFGSAYRAVNVFSSNGNVDRATTGKLSLQHQLDKTIMVYGSATTGYKGQAYDITSSLNATTAAQQPVKPETATSFELGMKGNFFENRMTVAATVFSSKFKNYQQNSGSYITSINAATGLPAVDVNGVQLPDIYVTRLNSIEGVQTQGAELDVNALVTADLLVNMGYAYTEARVTGFKNGQCYTVAGSPNGGFNAECILRNPLYGNANTNDVSGGDMPFAPRHKLTLGFRYSFPLLGFSANINGNYNYQSSMITNLNQDPTLFVEARQVINMGVGLREKSGRYGISLGVNNLLDDRFQSNRAFPLANFNAGPTTARTAVVTTSAWTPLRSSFRYFTARFDAKF